MRIMWLVDGLWSLIGPVSSCIHEHRVFTAWAEPQLVVVEKGRNSMLTLSGCMIGSSARSAGGGEGMAGKILAMNMQTTKGNQSGWPGVVGIILLNMEFTSSSNAWVSLGDW
jgi:hypothetical protein